MKSSVCSTANTTTVTAWATRPLTDRIFHPTDIGGLIIATGMPNSGKIDFLNDLTCRIMQQTDRFVCYLSFEVLRQEI